LGNKKFIKIVSLSLLCTFLLTFILPLKMAYGAGNSSDSKVVEEKLKGIIAEYGEKNIIFEDGISIKVGETIDLNKINPEANVKWIARDTETVVISDKLTGKSEGTTFLIGNSGDKHYVKEVYVYGNENNISFYRNSPRDHYLVYIDPGHGGYDPGAKGNGIVEKDLVLKLSMAIKSRLEEKGISVVTSRDKDEFVSLADRSNEANSISPDAFVSVHANSATVTSAAGIETFYYTNEDKPLAEELQSKLISYTGAVNRNTKYESYYVLKNTKVPSALVEVGFVSNANEAEKLKNESYQEKLINANVDAIVNYLNKNVSLSNKLISSTRISGINRYETSYKVFNQGWESSEYAVIVYGLDYPDALCATPLAAKYNAPIILAQNKRLTEQQDLVNILKEKGVKQVFIAGGTGIIPSSFEGDLKKLGISSKRLGGKDRYETSVAIAKELSSNTGEISLASGLGFADGLSISSIAGKRNMAVLLTGKDKLPKSVADYIKNSNINKTYIIGQTGVISDNVSKAVPNPERLGGANRFDTNKVVFDKFKTDINLENLYIASGLDFPDALSGSALAAKGSNFVVLSNLDVAENSIKELIKNNKAEIRSVYVLGGNSIVKDLTLNKLGIK